LALKSKDIYTILGVVLIVAGIGLALWGYQVSGEMNARLTNTITGSLPDAVIWRYSAGIVSFLVGAYLLRKG
jgi:hypothetical protein